MPRIHRDSIEHVTSTREDDRITWQRFRRGLAVAAVLAGVTVLAAPYASAEGKTAFLAEQLRKNQSFSVRIDAALKLGTSDDPAAVKPLCASLDDQSEVEAVRIASAAALGKLNKPGADECLKNNAKDSSAKVREQVATSLKAIGGSAPAGGGMVKCPDPPASGGKAKYYVAVGISNKSARPDGEIKQLIERQVVCKLQTMPRFKIAEKAEPKDMSAVVSKEKLDGYFLSLSIDPIKYDAGNLKISMKLTIMTHTRDLKGEIGKSLTMPGVSSPSKSDEDDLIKAAAEKLVNEFAGLKQ
jgi:hypothetical protein